jgi:hypothetical protein
VKDKTIASSDATCRTGEELADDQRADEREVRENIDAQTTVARGINHPPRRGSQPTHGRRCPDEIGGVASAGEKQHGAARKTDDRKYEQHSLDRSCRADHWGTAAHLMPGLLVYLPFTSPHGRVRQ